MKKNNQDLINIIVRGAIFGALATILYLIDVFSFPLPIFPPFMKIHFDEIPLFISSFAYGPVTGIFAIIVKTVIKLPFSQTFCVGELSDMLYSFVFIIPAALVYKKRRNFTGVIMGLILSTCLQISVSMFMNIYVMIPFYGAVLGLSNDTILKMCNAVNPLIVDTKWSLALYAVIPFNALKDIIIIVPTLVLYKALHKLIDKIDFSKKSKTI